MNPRFVDRHRAQLGFRVIEGPGRLLAEPKAFRLWPVVVWMAFIHALGFLFLYRYFRDEIPRFAILGLFEFPTLIGILYAIARHEVSRGPFLEVDTSRGVVVLARDHRQIDFDLIESLFVLTGWYEWTDWEEVAELSLIVRGDERVSEFVPVLLHREPRAVETLGARLAERIQKPIRRESLNWEARQRSVRAR